MNSDYPHDLASLEEIRKKSAAERARYVQVPEEHVQRLQDMTPDERAVWLAENPLSLADVELIARAQAKRDRRAARRRPPA